MDNDQEYNIPRSQDGQFQAEAQRAGMRQPSLGVNGQASMNYMQEPLSRSEQIELLELRLEVSKLKGVVNQLRHENQMLKHQGLMQSLVSVMNQPLVELKHDIMAMQNVAQSQSFSDVAIDRAFGQIEAKAARSPSILKLALSLAVRFLLVLGVAVLVLALVAK